MRGRDRRRNACRSVGGASAEAAGTETEKGLLAPTPGTQVPDSPLEPETRKALTLDASSRSGIVSTISVEKGQVAPTPQTQMTRFLPSANPEARAFDLRLLIA